MQRKTCMKGEIPHIHTAASVPPPHHNRQNYLLQQTKNTLLTLAGKICGPKATATNL